MRIQFVQDVIDAIRGKRKTTIIKLQGENNIIINNIVPTNRFRGSKNTISILGNNNKVEINDFNNLDQSGIVINGNNNKVIFRKDTYGFVHVSICANGCIVEIGEKTGFTGTEITLWDNFSRVIIGENCILAKETRLYCTDFHCIIDLETKMPINQGKEIIIGNHVWLGESVKMLKNKSIADNIIVGAGSIVSKNCLVSHSIYAGNPCVLKKTGITWAVETFDAIDKSEAKDAYTAVASLADKHG